jgi:hypothetical protein
MSHDLAPAAFHDHATARLRAGAILYGDASYQRPVRELLGEILEEAADIATWGAITVTVLERDSPPIRAADRAQVSAAIADATEHAEAAYLVIADAIQVLATTGVAGRTVETGTTA